MCRLVPGHTIWPIYSCPLPHHHLVMCEGEWTLASRAEATISIFFLLIWIQIKVPSRFCCCRLFRSMSVRSYSDWAVLQTGSLKDQVDTPSNKRFFCGGGGGLFWTETMLWGNSWNNFQIFCMSTGIFFILPCTDSFVKVDLRTVSFDIPPQEVEQLCGEEAHQLLYMSVDTYPQTAMCFCSRSWPKTQLQCLWTEWSTSESVTPSPLWLT